MIILSSLWFVVIWRAVVDQEKTISHLGIDFCSIGDTFEIIWGRKLAEKGNLVRNLTIADEKGAALLHRATGMSF
jgi:hypothetical protein